MLESPEKASRCHYSEMARGSVPFWDLRRLWWGVPAPCVPGICCSRTAGGLELLLIFPGDWL